MHSQKRKNSGISSFRRKPESSVFRKLRKCWTPDQALQRRCQELEAEVHEREQTCADLEQHLAQLTNERSQVADRVQNLLERIDRWQTDNTPGHTAPPEDGGQGKLFALSS